MTDSEIVMVPVPREQLQAVYEVLARPSSGSSPPAMEWTTGDFRELRSVLQPAAAALLDLTSSQPGRWIHIDAVIKQSGRPFYNVRGDLAALTRQIKRIGKSRWPFEYRQDSDGRMRYRMSHSVARMWKEAGG